MVRYSYIVKFENSGIIKSTYFPSEEEWWWLFKTISDIIERGLKKMYFSTLILMVSR